MATTTQGNGKETKLPAPRGIFDTFFGPEFGRYPFPELSTFRRTMNSLLDNVMMPEATFISAPATDVYEKDGKYVVEAALPGFKKEDISIEVADNQLKISAKTNEEKKEDQGARYHYRELRRGSFYRTIAFPADIDADNIEASYDNGILTLTVPPMKPVAAKKVAIKG
ncbi:MAG: Hsp20/alpha crystallin family protein [Candidatus Eremiobacteraeota bacterium]|nr:Hsp20/alpha crystallin family protein [Candidatus Eremiobacteraeota bacterium]MBV8366274.1 Hsp20/alpha crystallin family protein [Candidatus Eremiobacteraeota bacterium]